MKDAVEPGQFGVDSRASHQDSVMERGVVLAFSSAAMKC
jgi:hypothetical protein